MYQITLIFGRSCPDGSAVSAGEWSAFIQNEIASRFDAFTLTTATGYWKGEAEVSETFSLYTDWESLNDAHAKAVEVAAIYCQKFNQDCVLLDITQGHQVAFITKDSKVS
jgi:hypothetical protein